MKKRTYRERKEALKEAYYNELRKMGILDTPVVKTLEEMTKKELIEEGNKLGIVLNERQTKKELIAAIESYNNPVEEVTEETIEEAIVGEVNVLDEPITEENVYVEEVVETPEVVEEVNEEVENKEEGAEVVVNNLAE